MDLEEGWAHYWASRMDLGRLIDQTVLV